MATLRNWAHDAVAVVGILLGLQAPIVAYATTLGAPEKILSAVFGGMGLLATVLSKLIDSRSFTDIQTAPTK